jgi:competence protein ComEC
LIPADRLRQELEHRPLLIAFAAMVVGIASALAPLVVLLAVGGLLFVRSVRSRLVVVVAVVVGVLMGLGQRYEPVRERGYAQGMATVITMPRSTPLGISTVVELDGRRLLLYAPREWSLVIGDRLRVAGVVRPVKESGQRFAESRAIAGTMEPAGGAVLMQRGPAVNMWASALRAGFLSFLDATVRPLSASMIGALCFNADEDLPQDLRTGLQRSGVFHIISTSGLHVVFVTVALVALMRLLPIPRVVQLGVTAGAIAVYVAAAGMHPPAVRAAVMAAVLGGAYLVRREPDALSAIALAGIGSLLVLPGGVQDIGFQLSYVTMFALAMFGQAAVPARIAWARPVWAGIWASLVATVASAPLVGYHFGYASLIAVLGNLLIGLAVPVVMVVALGSWALWAVLPGFAGALMRWIAEPLTGWIMACSTWLGGMPWSSVEVPEFPAWLLLPLYAGLVLCWRPVAREP